jgi:hypothetical protein
MKQSLVKAVRERARFCCEYCFAQALFSSDSFSTEHIIPRIKNGLTVLENLAFSCQRCNNHKFTATESIDPITGSFAPLYNPRTDTWAAHFEWNGDFTEILGISSTGRATVLRLNLNREGLVNLRKVLHQTGFHPPF